MNELEGLLNVNKQSGVTSFWIVKQIRKILEVNKVGHCGTLDPMAEGILLVLFGKATKMQSSLMKRKKTYRARIRLGVSTDTGDITGNILKTLPVPVLIPENISEILKTFQGEIQQIPPMYSAIKHKGKRLYSLARKGIEVPREPRAINIYKIELLRNTFDMIEIRTECSSGTYVRTLAEDIGNKIGCGATMEYLCREKSGPFLLDGALDGIKINQLSKSEILEKKYSIEQIEILAAREDA